MSPGRWERINRLFLKCVPLADAERAALLNLACGNDGELRSIVESLLRADGDSRATAFLKPKSRASLVRLLVNDEKNGRNGPASGRLVGPYRLHDLLGIGGTSAVYRARLIHHENPDPERPAPFEFAFKLIANHVLTDEVICRFRIEQKILVSISHPNVVRYFDSGLTDDGLPYLVMELVDGQRIDMYADDNELSVRERVELFLRICDAVESIPQCGVLHRDLTPPNILVTAQGVPKLVDFGIAKSVGPLLESLSAAPQTATDAIIGTPAYLSPEQVSGRKPTADVRSDIYTLGVLLYRLLTGRTPFQGVTMANLLDEIRLSDPVPPSRLNSGISRSLESICMTCLQKQPRRRYASAESLAADLRGWLDGRPIRAKPVPSAVKAWRWCYRRPVVAALASALLLTLSVGFLAVFALWRHAETERDRADLERRSALAERAHADDERRRAQADLRIADEALGQIIELCVGGAYSLPRKVSPQSRVAFLERTRKSLLELVERLPDHVNVCQRLVPVELGLCDALIQENRCEEVRLLLDDSQREFNRILRNDPQDRWGLIWQVNSLRLLAMTADRQGKVQESVDRYRQAVRASEDLTTVAPDSLAHANLAQIRWALSRLLVSQGKTDEAKSLAKANLKMIESLPAEFRSADCEPLRVVVELGLHRLSSSSLPTPRSAPQFADSGSVALPSLASPEADCLPPAEWAQRAAQTLRSAKGPGALTSQEDSTGYQFIRFLGIVAADERRLGELDRARRTADRMLAFAQLLVARTPNHAAAHLALGDAYCQLSKNAWRLNDRAAVERDLALSLAASLHALDLDPKNEIASYVVAQRRQRLQNLQHPN
jgi:eukaryotic-like serine/threonine-protein kinase